MIGASLAAPDPFPTFLLTLLPEWLILMSARKDLGLKTV